MWPSLALTRPRSALTLAFEGCCWAVGGVGAVEGGGPDQVVGGAAAQRATFLLLLLLFLLLWLLAQLAALPTFLQSSRGQGEREKLLTEGQCF